MKLTKKMEALIDKRAKLAEDLAAVSAAIDDFLFNNGIIEEIERYDWGTGCEIYVNPRDSSERVKEAIRNH